MFWSFGESDANDGRYAGIKVHALGSKSSLACHLEGAQVRRGGKDLAFEKTQREILRSYLTQNDNSR